MKQQRIYIDTSNLKNGYPTIEIRTPKELVKT